MRRHWIARLHEFNALHHRPRHQQHAWTATVRAVIDLVMSPRRKIADIGGANIDQTTTVRSPKKASLKETGKNFRKECEYVDAHGV